MPKNKVKTVNVNKIVFMIILKEKNSSIRKLGAAEDINFTEKTIRRALNNGEMRPELVKQIAKHLNIDSSLLTGELVKKAFTAKNEIFKDKYLEPLYHLENYPYYREESRELSEVNYDGMFVTGGFQETMTRLLDIFDVSYKQYEELEFETKYHFEKELYEAMIPIIRKYFKKDAFGNGDSSAFIGILSDLEHWKDSHDDLIYADTVIRKKYLENPPKGLTKDKIIKMSSQEILDYDIGLSYQEAYDFIHNNSILAKYKNYPIINENDTDEDVQRKIKEAKSKGLSQ